MFVAKVAVKEKPHGHTDKRYVVLYLLSLYLIQQTKLLHCFKCSKAGENIKTMLKKQQNNISKQNNLNVSSGMNVLTTVY